MKKNIFKSLSYKERRSEKNMVKKIIALLLFGFGVCLVMSIGVMISYN